MPSILNTPVNEIPIHFFYLPVTQREIFPLVLLPLDLSDFPWIFPGSPSFPTAPRPLVFPSNPFHLPYL